VIWSNYKGNIAARDTPKKKKVIDQRARGRTSPT